MPHVIQLKDGKLLIAFEIRDVLEVVENYIGQETRKYIEEYLEENIQDTKDFETKIKGKSANRLVLGFNKFTIPDNKIFEIELYEKGGGRHMKLAVENKYIIRAEPLFEK